MTRPTWARRRRTRPWSLALVFVAVVLLWGAAVVEASVGDRLPEFRDCVEVCKSENCGPDAAHTTPIPLHRRLLFWTCPAECDYTCQHIVTARRVADGQPVVQFHGKWPFQRILGMQEPLSVLFSAGNLWAHVSGLRRLRRRVPAAYPLRPWYVGFGLAGCASWVFSMIFHTRDSTLTERLDYFAAGASVLYGLYYTPVRLFRLDKPFSPRRRSVLRLWTVLCLLLYAAHVGYLTLVRWDYGYNMAANVACGVVQNALWSWYSWDRWRTTHRAWTVWPGIAVAWVTMAMGLELFDFPPLWGTLDAHSLWHAGTIAPTVLWYNFMVKDAQDDMAHSERLKA